jgi:putative endonuclease
MYYLYILKSINYNKSYIGITNNIERRLAQHNQGYSFYTKKYKPWKLIYKKMYINRCEARKREKYLKAASGRKWLKKNIF